MPLSDVYGDEIVKESEPYSADLPGHKQGAESKEEQPE